MTHVLQRLLDRLPGLGRLGVHVPKSREQEPRREAARTVPRFDELPQPETERALGAARTLLVHHPEPHPPRGEELTVMTFNIYMGGKRREALEHYFEELEESGRMPDVIGLQEANLPVAARLAEKHGFHLVYFGASGQQDGQRLVNGKALLSRYPVRDAAHFTYAIEPSERQEAIHLQGRDGELVEDRGALRVLLDVGGRTVAVYDVHHTLGDTGINANDLHQLNMLLAQREEAVPAVVLGDFNANTSIKRDGTWLMAQLRHYDDTHTIEEYQARYGDIISSVGDRGVGNIADKRIRKEFHRLEKQVPETIAHARQVRVRRADGTCMTPREARERLNSGEVEKDSEEWRRLQDVADAATLHPEPDESGVAPATGKRFDNIYASRELKPMRLEVDRSTDASDHLPVLASFQLH